MIRKYMEIYFRAATILSLSIKSINKMLENSENSFTEFKVNVYKCLILCERQSKTIQWYKTEKILRLEKLKSEYFLLETINQQVK